MRRSGFDDMPCSVAQTLELIGDWWTPLLIRDLLMGVSRFDEFQGRLGISRNILTERLNSLVANGIVERVAYQQHPERFDYRLTEKGQDLWRVIEALRSWGDRWAAPNGPPVELVHTSCGHVTESVPVCAECGEPLRRGEMRLVAGPGAGDSTPLPVRRHVPSEVFES